MVSTLENGQVFACDLCGSQFRDRSNARRHVRFVHSAEQSVDCEFCGATLKNIRCLKAHVKSIHSDTF